MMARIYYRDEQGVLMRILTELSRRAIQLPYVLAINGCVHLRVEVTDKQKAQLLRAWKGIVGVTHVDTL